MRVDNNGWPIFDVKRVCHIYCHISVHIKKCTSQHLSWDTKCQKNVRHACGQEDTGLGKKGWAILRVHKKNNFGAIPYFLEITNVGEAYLIFERISVLPKVYSTNRPNRLKTLLKVFWQFKTLLKVFLQFKTLLKFICLACLLKSLCVFCHTSNNCYHICTIRTLLLCTNNNSKY